MTAETIREHTIVDVRVIADDCVLVEHVVLVVAGPAVFNAQGFEFRNTMSKCRPDDFVEDSVVDFVQRQVIRVIVRTRRRTADIRLPLRAKIDAGRVDQQGAVF